MYEIKKNWCAIKTAGNHIDPQVVEDGDQYCVSCEEYLYTNYNFQESLCNMRNAWKMWWEIKE